MANEITTIKKKICLRKTDVKTVIVALAISIRVDENRPEKISCKVGLPISDVIYDQVSDAYYVECADYMHVGEVPFGYEAFMEGVSYWNVTMPLPESVFRPALSEQAIQKLDAWRTRLPKRWKIKYVQLTSVF